MSRILAVTNDDRTIPHNVCWWRLSLPKNDAGHVAVTQYHIPENKLPWDGSWTPWSGHIDYFDDRNDWSWPFSATLTNNHAEMDNKYGGEYLITFPTKFYLNVLDVLPPDVSETSRWLQVTEPGDRRLPTEQRLSEGCRMPRARPGWWLTTCPPIW